MTGEPPAPPPGTPPGAPPGPAAAPAAPAPAPPLSKIRVGVGLLLGVITVLVLVLDAVLGARAPFHAAAPGTGLLIALLSAAAVHEFCLMARGAAIESLPAWAAGSSFTILALRAWLPAAGVEPEDAAALSVVALLLAILLPGAARVGFRSPGAGEGAGPAEGANAAALRPLAGTALALLAVHLPMALLLELRLVPDGPGLMFGAFPDGLVLATMAAVACKTGDSIAYFVGRTVGRTPLCWVSPKKTWEGAVAGVLAGTAAAAVLGWFLGLSLLLGLSFGLVVNLAGQGGDLAESWFKRCCGVKDSGRTFGEMGGALDLVDALLLAGPAGFLFHRVALT